MPHYLSIDGLRGIAVLLVLFFHVALALPWQGALSKTIATPLRYGWIGVDIFFVISGFLITGILLRTREKQKYFLNFYFRRILRIMPAYYMLLLAVFVVMPMLLPFESAEMTNLKSNQLWLWTHLTNWGYVWHRTVFTSADWLNLDHLWTLAVEEQYYLVWPLVVFFFTNRRLKYVCVTCILFSFTLRMICWQLGIRNGALYFPTPCRLDCLSMGAMVAIYVLEYGVSDQLVRIAKWVFAGSCLGIAVITAVRGGFEFIDSFVVVFGITLVGAATSSLIVLMVAENPNKLLISTMTWKPLRWVGKYSYGLYLLHMVVLAPMRYLEIPQRLKHSLGNEVIANAAFVLLFFTLSFGVAVVSWHCNEKHC